MRKETADKIISLRHILLGCAILAACAFLTFSVLGLCHVLTTTTSAMLAIAALFLFCVALGISQLPVNPSFAKIDFVLAGLLVLCFFVVLVLRTTNLMA